MLMLCHCKFNANDIIIGEKMENGWREGGSIPVYAPAKEYMTLVDSQYTIDEEKHNFVIKITMNIITVNDIKHCLNALNKISDQVAKHCHIIPANGELIRFDYD